MKRASTLCIILFFLTSGWAQVKAPQERSFAAEVESIKAALKELGAYTGGRLPTLNGFIEDTRQLGDYQHPYYEFKIELLPQGDNTLVRVKANVSAWYSEGDSSQGMYRSLPSNGRLETDLLDRLKTYLTDHLVTVTTDTALLQQHIANLREKRSTDLAKLDDLKRRASTLEAATSPERSPRLVSPARTNTAVYAEPSEAASVVFSSGIEDEFEVLETRESWYRVKIGRTQSAWLRRSQTHEVLAKAPVSEPSKEVAAKNAFRITREQMFPFAGDWPRLKNKDALFLFVQPNPGSSPSATSDLKLKFAEMTFVERLAQMTHDSSSKRFDGIVIIFLDQKGGVAAATIPDIKQWREGSLTRSAFIAKCSLDPRAAFVPKPEKPTTPAHVQRQKGTLPVSMLRSR